MLKEMLLVVTTSVLATSTFSGDAGRAEAK